MLTDKVKKALSKKDETITVLKEDNELKDIQIAKLKELMEKQRMEALGIH